MIYFGNNRQTRPEMKRIVQSIVYSAPRLRNIQNRCIGICRNFTTQSTAPPSANQPIKQPTLNLSESCIKKLEEISKQENKKYLRLIVDGGGCSGFQYKFELNDKVNEDDVIFGQNNSQIIVDNVSLEYCAGATIDYHTELIKSGFRVVGNPKAEQGCSCGASFALKLD